MQKLPRLSGKEVVRILAKTGFFPARQRGSHIIMAKHTEQGKKALVVPNHREIDKGTLLEIIRQAGLTKEEFLKLV
jgi:predicted RNA binding protein YcfA (HicA-like mRNA interferase family)